MKSCKVCIINSSIPQGLNDLFGNDSWTIHHIGIRIGHGIYSPTSMGPSILTGGDVSMH